MASTGPGGSQKPVVSSMSPTRVVEAQTIKPSSAAFRGPLVGGWIGSGAVGTQIVARRRCQHHRRQLYYVTMQPL